MTNGPGSLAATGTGQLAAIVKKRQFDTMWSYDPVFIITTGPSQASADAVMTGIIKALTGHQH